MYFDIQHTQDICTVIPLIRSHMKAMDDKSLLQGTVCLGYETVTKHMWPLYKVSCKYKM